jgi:hypothetical protein
MNPLEVAWEGVDWFILAQDGEKWRVCEHGTELASSGNYV